MEAEGLRCLLDTSRPERHGWQHRIQMASNLRILTLAGTEQGIGFPFQQWYTAAALGYQGKPILREHLLNIDPDKERYFLFGGGYEFLHTTNSGKQTDENRVTLDGTFGFRPTARFLLRDRNWLELRWINGAYSTTYRNMVTVERDFLVRGLRFSPYGSAEFFYDSPKHSWDQEWYTGGIEWPYRLVGRSLRASYRGNVRSERILTPCIHAIVCADHVKIDLLTSDPSHVRRG